MFGILLRGWCGWEILGVVGAGWQRAEVVMERRRMRWATVWLVAGVVVTAGCTTGGGTTTPTTTPVTTSSSPTSSSAAPTTTTMSDDEAATEAVRKHYQLFNAALMSLDTAQLRKSFSATCTSCDSDAKVIEQVKAKGGRIETSGIQLSSVTIVDRQGSRLLIQAQVAGSPIVIRDASGKVIDSSTGGTGVKNILTSKASGVWLVEAIT